MWCMHNETECWNINSSKPTNLIIVDILCWLMMYILLLQVILQAISKSLNAGFLKSSVSDEADQSNAIGFLCLLQNLL